MKKQLPVLVILITGLLILTACNKGSNKDDPGKLNLYFTHLADGSTLEFDTLKYLNAAGNPYLVSEIQYFISDVTVYRDDGTAFLLDSGEDIHYVDTDLPDTWNYALPDDIEPGTYDSISFTFGINEEKNKSQLFVNPPESNMFWPELLNGGYHYMKLNGKWKSAGDTIRPFNFHMGIGQVYDTLTGVITDFVQNYFRVSLPASGFTIEPGKTVSFEVRMDVQQWFENPHVYDLNYWGGKMMQNQAALQTAKENGHNVFSVQKLLLE